jgi:SAM-dependent methyltransferase
MVAQKLNCPYCEKDNLTLKRKITSILNNKRYEHYLCNFCDLEFFTPLKFDFTIYEGEGMDAYKEFHSGRKYTPEWTKNIIKVLKNKNINFKNKNILEIGAGDGVNFTIFKNVKSFHISAENYHIVELDKKSINICKKRGIKKIYNSFFSSDFIYKCDIKYDYILLPEVIEHQVNLNDFLTTAFSILNKSGKIIISVPNRDRFFLSQKENPHDLPPHHFLRFNKFFFKKNFKNKIDYLNDYSYSFNLIFDSSKILSKKYLNNDFFWIFFLPISFTLRILDRLRGEGLIVILKNE